VKTYTGIITRLEPNQVFVFGSNLTGFHGAGSAGFASFGVAGNKWRYFKYDEKPFGWKGNWNIKGRGEGLQEGVRGKSYALPTVTKAGAKKSFTLKQIRESIAKLYRCAREHPELEFLIAYTGSGGKLLNGYTLEDMAFCFADFPDIPENVVFEKDFVELVELATIFRK
jgi:hypothetical protein